MDERRKEQRKSLMAYTKVYDLYGGVLLGYLGDLNLSGAMVIGDKAIVANTELTLAIELPELKGITMVRMTIPARTAWIQQDISPQFINIGFEFKEVSAGQKKLIEAVIANYEFRRDVPKYVPNPHTDDE